MSLSSVGGSGADVRTGQPQAAMPGLSAWLWSSASAMAAATDSSSRAAAPATGKSLGMTLSCASASFDRKVFFRPSTKYNKSVVSVMEPSSDLAVNFTGM